jgi:hypothetical protein
MWGSDTGELEGVPVLRQSSIVILDGHGLLGRTDAWRELKSIAMVLRKAESVIRGESTGFWK